MIKLLELKLENYYMEDKNLKYIRQGKTGCVFASIMARNPKKVGWSRYFNPKNIIIGKDDYIVSYIFKGKDKEYVKNWALSQGMYEDITSKNTTGLRWKKGDVISWVQYFGPDSHVKTRQAPEPELLFCVQLPKNYYNKVGFKGVLHLAHSSVSHIKENILDRIWESCFKRTEKILGYKPTIIEAAKTTYKN